MVTWQEGGRPGGIVNNWNFGVLQGWQLLLSPCQRLPSWTAGPATCSIFFAKDSQNVDTVIKWPHFKKLEIIYNSFSFCYTHGGQTKCVCGSEVAHGLPRGRLGADPTFSFDSSRSGRPERGGELPKAMQPAGSGSQDWAVLRPHVIGAHSKVRRGTRSWGRPQAPPRKASRSSALSSLVRPHHWLGGPGSLELSLLTPPRHLSL